MKKIEKASDSFDGLSIPQVRVLQVLTAGVTNVKDAKPMTRSAISRKIGNKTTVMAGRAVGYSDPEKRRAFEQTKDGGFRESLLSLKYVKEVELDIDGVVETCIEITDKGLKAFRKLGAIQLPPLRD